MSNCLPNTTVVLDETPLICPDFISTDCVIYPNAISYLELPADSTMTNVVVSLVLSLIDARNRIETLENTVISLDARITALEP